MFDIPETTQAFWSRLDLTPARAEQINEIADLVQAPLPEDYVTFLQTYGFARWMLTVPDRFRYRQAQGGQQVEKVGSVSHLETPESLRRAVEHAWKDNPEMGLPCWPTGVMPIAGNAGQGQVLMDLSGTPGAVLYWEPAEHPWGQGDNTQLWQVAPNFTDFINGLSMRDKV